MAANMLDRVTVETFYSPLTFLGFRLDHPTRGKLGSAAPANLLASSNGEQWVSITDEVRNLEITRGSAPDALTASPEVGTLSISFINRPARDLRPSFPIRVTADGKRLFTGQILDLREIEIRDKGTSEATILTTLTAVDRLAQISNTMRFGAYQTPPEETPWHTFETSAERFARYLRPVSWEWNAPAEPLVNEWNERGAWILGTSEGSLVNFPGTETEPAIVRYTMFYDPPGSGFSMNRTIGNLPPSTEVTLSAWIRSAGATPVSTLGGVSLPASGAWVRWTATRTTSAAGIASITLTATGFAPSSTAIVELTGLTVTAGKCAPLEIQNIVYESTLANHLDLTANTTKGAWWIDKHNVLQVRICDHPPAGSLPHFTDGTKPGTFSYVDLEAAYDTAGIVNDLVFNNHGRALDPETNSYHADDVSIHAGSDPTSIATFGERSEEIETALPITAPAIEVLAENLPRLLGNAYLAEAASPQHAPRNFRVWNAPGLATPDLDVRDSLQITRRSETWNATIVGISHQITREHWHTNYTILPRRNG